MAATYTFDRLPLSTNALGYAEPKSQPEVIDLTDDTPAVKQEPAPPLPPAQAEGDEDQYTCPISLELMVDPVLADDGHMYDLEFLVKWFATKAGDRVKSPKTNEPMTKGCVRPWAFHKAYAEWAASHGHPAPVAAGPYGRVVVAVPAPAPAPAPAPRVVVPLPPAQPAPAPAPRVVVPLPPAQPAPAFGIVEVSLNCTDAPNIRLRVHACLAGRFVPAGPLADRFSRLSQDDARAILKANFPDITIRTDYDLKGALKGLILCMRAGGSLWDLPIVRRVVRIEGDLQFNVRLTVEQYIHIRGPTTTVPEVLKRLTLPMLKDVAMRHAPQLVASMSTKAHAVQVLAAHFTPLCTPVPAQ